MKHSARRGACGPQVVYTRSNIVTATALLWLALHSLHFGKALHTRATSVNRAPARARATAAAGERAHGEPRHRVRLVQGGRDGECLATQHGARVHGLASLLPDGPQGQRISTRRERLGFVRQAMALHARASLRINQTAARP